MSKKKYNWEKNKEVGCNKTRGWLLTGDQIAAVRFYLYLAGLEFKFEARRKLKDGMPKSLVLHEWRKFRETQQLAEEINSHNPHAYVRA